MEMPKHECRSPRKWQNDKGRRNVGDFASRYLGFVIDSSFGIRISSFYQFVSTCCAVGFEEIGKLARAGANFGLISANTPHIVFDEVASKSPIPLISIVEATCAAAKARKLKRLGLFGTRFTMQGTFYPKVFSREGIELVAPEAKDQEYIHDKYLNELVPGKFLPETRDGLLAIVDRMHAKSDIDSVILAGTELPLILHDADHKGIPLLDTTRIHCQAAVAEMFS